MQSVVVGVGSRRSWSVTVDGSVTSLSDLPDPEYPVCELYFPTLSLCDRSGGGGEWGFGDFSGSVHIKLTRMGVIHSQGA